MLCIQTFTVGLGLMETFLDISTKDDFNFVYIVLHKNTTHVGTLNSDYMQFKMHNLERAFLSCSVQTRIPSIPYGHSGKHGLSNYFIMHKMASTHCNTHKLLITLPGDVEGFSFADDYATKCSYLHVLDTMGKLTEHGTEDFSLESFKTKKFILPFKLSPSINSLDSVTTEMVQQNSVNPISNQRKLYLKFKSNTTYAIRVSCLYFQHRSIAIDQNKRVFKSYDLDQ